MVQDQPRQHQFIECGLDRNASVVKPVRCAAPRVPCVSVTVKNKNLFGRGGDAIRVYFSPLVKMYKRSTGRDSIFDTSDGDAIPHIRMDPAKGDQRRGRHHIRPNQAKAKPLIQAEELLIQTYFSSSNNLLDIYPTQYSHASPLHTS